MFRVVDADMFELRGHRFVIDGHDILGVPSGMHDVSLVELIIDFEENAEDLVRCLCWLNIYFACRRHWNLYKQLFGLVMDQRMFLRAAEDRADILCHFAKIATMPLMDFVSLDLDWG